jgi:FMN phosphatase YigB (HAD superfamily)
LKPHPEIFHRALRALALQPDRVLHVGDRMDCDVQGARAAGLRAAWFGPNQRAESAGADLCFADWSLFLPLLRRRGWIAP